jgi:hypothetical protein
MAESLPAQFFTQLTNLSFLAEGLLVPRLAAQFCEALSQLPLLHTLALSRLQLSAQAAQLLGQTLMELPRLSQLALSGGAALVGAAELYVLLNGEQLCGVFACRWVPMQRFASITVCRFVDVYDTSAALHAGLLGEGCWYEPGLARVMHTNNRKLGVSCMISSAYMLPAELLALGSSAHLLLTTSVYLYLLLSVVELPQLRGLELTRLGVRMLPLSLTRLAGLTRLTFSGEMLRNVQLRDELRQLSNLQVLDISANLAEQLPMGVLELSGLRELHAGERCRLRCCTTHQFKFGTQQL